MSAETSNSATPLEKLPFWRTFADAHRCVIGAGADFWRFAGVWLLVLLALDGMSNWLSWPLQDNTTGHMPGEAVVLIVLLPLVSLLLWIVVGGIVGVPLHRLLLADRIAAIGATRLSAGARTYRLYIVRNIVIAALAFLLFFAVIFVGLQFVDTSFVEPVPTAPASANEVADISADLDWTGGSRLIGPAFVIGALVLMTPLIALLAYIPVRLSLALPATAIDCPEPTFKHAWAASFGSFWRLFWGGLLSYWPLLPVTALEYAATGFESPSQVHYVICQSIATAAGFLAGLVWVAFFSLAYRHLVPKPI